jgi:hypothetical protein
MVFLVKYTKVVIAVINSIISLFYSLFELPSCVYSDIPCHINKVVTEAVEVTSFNRGTRDEPPK